MRGPRQHSRTPAPFASACTTRWWVASSRRTWVHRSVMGRTRITPEPSKAASTAVHCRRLNDGGDEHVLLDENVLAGDHGYFQLGDAEVSPDHAILAYTVDFTGGERFTLHMRTLGTGIDLPDVLEDVSYSLAWSTDSTRVFYTRPDDAMRPWQVWRHRVGTPNDADVLVLQEDDQRFFASVARTRSGAYILISLNSQITSEVHLLRADDPTGAPSVIEPRRQAIEYAVDHHEDRFFIVTNDDALNFRLVAAPVATPGREHWVEVIPHREDVNARRRRPLRPACRAVRAL